MRQGTLGPNSTARCLLGMAARQTTGAVEFGERVFYIHQGRLVGTHGLTDELDLPTYLLQARKIDNDTRLQTCLREARQTGQPLRRLLITAGILSAQKLREALRARWLQQLIESFKRVEGHDDEIRLSNGMAAELTPSFSVPVMVLRALTANISPTEIESLQESPDHRFEWLAHPLQMQAMQWTDWNSLDDSPIRVKDLIEQRPGSPPQIVALIHAGLGRIVSHPTAPVPNVVFAPDGDERQSVPSLSAIMTLPSPEEITKAELALAPGSRIPPPPDITFDLALPTFEAGDAELNDPFDPLESKIQDLQAAAKNQHELALCWRTMAATWLQRYASVAEATRCYREAAAADPGDFRSLSEASQLCVAMGQPDLALAYARALVKSAEDKPGTHAVALLHYSLLLRQLGRTKDSLGALQVAIERDPAHPECHALAVHLWLSLGRSEEAADAADQAAEHLRVSDPARSLALRALAADLAPSFPRTEAHADELAAQGYMDAAIAVRAFEATHATNPDERRTLLLSATEHAELAQRPILAASLLERAFDAEPHIDLFYLPLDTELESTALKTEHAVLTDEIAASASREMKALWLLRAAELRAEMQGDSFWENELRICSLELEPNNREHLEAVIRQSRIRSDYRLLADALERAILRGHWEGPEPQATMLRKLAKVAITKLHAPELASWAFERIRDLLPDDAEAAESLELLQADLETSRAERRELERQYAQAGGHEKLELARQLAEHLVHTPRRRRQAAALYREILDAEPANHSAAESLTRLLQLAGDADALADSMADRANRTGSASDRVRFLMRLAAMQMWNLEFRSTAETCRKVLDILPSHREAMIRLRRSACRLADRELLREALIYETRSNVPDAQRANLLARLALELENIDQVQEAIARAKEAMDIDPRNGTAALLLLRHIAQLPDAGRQLPALRAILGENHILDQAFTAQPDHDAKTWPMAVQIFRSAGRLFPYTNEAHHRWLSRAIQRQDHESIREATESLLSPERLVPASAAPINLAIEELSPRHLETAVTCAVKACDAFGAAGSVFRDLVHRLIPDVQSQTVRREALERLVLTETPQDRHAFMHQIAETFRSDAHLAGEARAYLRILAFHPQDARALQRLADIYTQTDNAERLSAVLNLQLEFATDAERYPLLILMASAAAHLDRDDWLERWLTEAIALKDLPIANRLSAAAHMVHCGLGHQAVLQLRKLALNASNPDAEKLYQRAVQTAYHALEDGKLALQIAIDALHHLPDSGALLLLFEQITLERQELDVADAMYDKLTETAMGPHSRWALAYRRARWLEQANHPKLALDAYAQAFHRSPQAGVIFSSIKRLAQREGKLTYLVDACLTLGEQASHGNMRYEMTRRGAKLLEVQMKDPVRALEVLLALWVTTARTELDGTLCRLIREVRTQAPEQAEDALNTMEETLRVWIDDAWMSESKARFLRRWATIQQSVLSDLDAVRATIDTALRHLRTEEANLDLQADLSFQLANWYQAAGKPDAAAEYAKLTLQTYPHHASAKALLSQVNDGVAPALPNTSPSDTAATMPEPEDTSQREASALDPLQDVVPRALVAPLHDAPPPVDGLYLHSAPPAATDEPLSATDNGAAAISATHGQSLPPEDNDASGDAIADDADDDDFGEAPPSSMTAIGTWTTSAPPSSPSNPALDPAAMADQTLELALKGQALLSTGNFEEATKHFRSALVLAPDRVDTLPALREAAQQANDELSAELATSLLSLVDDNIQPKGLFPELDDSDIDRLVLDPLWGTSRKLWRIIYHNAMPLVRDAAVRDLDEAHLVSQIETSAVGRSFHHVLKRLRPEITPRLYLQRDLDDSLRMLCDHPPKLVAGAHFEARQGMMVFAMARAMTYVRPEHLLVMTLPETEVRNYIQAVAAAFGPPDKQGEVDRAAASLAADLWGSVPQRAQADIRELLIKDPRWHDLEGHRQAIMNSSVRAGLLACGDLGTAAAAILRTLDIPRPTTLKGLSELVADIPLLRALIAFAFGQLSNL